MEVTNKTNLMVSVEKTKTVNFGKETTLQSKSIFKRGGNNVNIGSKIECIGLIIEEKLNWIPHIEMLRETMIGLYPTLKFFQSRNYKTPEHSRGYDIFRGQKAIMLHSILLSLERARCPEAEISTQNSTALYHKNV